MHAPAGRRWISRAGNPYTAAKRLRSRLEEHGDTAVRALPLWTLLVDAEIARGDVGAGRRAAAKGQRLAELTRSRRHEAEALFADAKVRAASGDPQAPAALRQAARRLSNASLQLAACRARLALARSVAATDHGTAITEARAALAALDRLGARPDADEAAAFLRSLGVKGRTGPKELGLLSQREHDVLRLIAQGLSNREIAERLFIRVKTAGHHVSKILLKLGLRSRTKAAAYAAVHLPPAPPANGAAK